MADHLLFSGLRPFLLPNWHTPSALAEVVNIMYTFPARSVTELNERFSEENAIAHRVFDKAWPAISHAILIFASQDDATAHELSLLTEDKSKSYFEVVESMLDMIDLHVTVTRKKK